MFEQQSPARRWGVKQASGTHSLGTEIFAQHACSACTARVPGLHKLDAVDPGSSVAGTEKACTATAVRSGSVRGLLAYPQLCARAASCRVMPLPGRGCVLGHQGRRNAAECSLCIPLPTSASPRLRSCCPISASRFCSDAAVVVKVEQQHERRVPAAGRQCAPHGAGAGSTSGRRAG